MPHPWLPRNARPTSGTTSPPAAHPTHPDTQLIRFVVRQPIENPYKKKLFPWCSSCSFPFFSRKLLSPLCVRMAVGGGGVCVASSSSSPASVEAAWGRRTSGRARRGAGAGAPAAATAVRCSSSSTVGGEAGGPGASGGLAEDPYRTLRLRPGATRGDVKKAFRRLALTYHPDVRKESGGDSGVQFERINMAYQMLMSNMREADERLEYWRLKYGLTDEDLDRYRHHLNQEDGDDWFDM